MPDPQPVLEVAAISYDEVEHQQRVRANAKSKPTRKPRSASKRKTTKGQATRPHGRVPSPVVPEKPGRGELGPTIVAEVKAKMETGMKASQAFTEVGQERGMKVGAVSANYYRVLRTKAKQAPRPGRNPKAASAPRKVRPKPAPSDGSRRRAVASGEARDIDAITTDLVASVRAFAEAVKEQGVEVREVRARLDGVRSLLG